MSDKPWRLVPVNAPQAVRGKKAGLLSWPRRGWRLAGLLRRHRVTVAACQEVGLRTQEALRRRAHGFLFWLGRKDEPAPWYVAKGILADGRRMRRLHRRQLRIALPRGAKRFVPAQLLADRVTQWRLLVLAGHADRKRPDPTNNIAVLDATFEAAAKWHRVMGVPVAVVLDTNNAPAAKRLAEKHGLELLGGEGIDLTFGIGLDVVGSERLTGFRGVVTDHPDPVAVDVLPDADHRVTDVVRIPGLPRN